MPRLRSRPFATPDELRSFAHGSAEVVRLDETLVGRATYEPGWRWTTDMPDIAGTSTCQLHHLGYSISGLMHVVTDDGQELDIHPESVYEIPSGHDAWVVGDEPWVTVESTMSVNRTVARTRSPGPSGGTPNDLALVHSTVTHGSLPTTQASWPDGIS